MVSETLQRHPQPRAHHAAAVAARLCCTFWTYLCRRVHTAVQLRLQNRLSPALRLDGDGARRDRVMAYVCMAYIVMTYIVMA